MLNCVSCVVVAFVAGRRWALFNDIVVGECGVANSQACEDSFFVFCVLMACCEVSYFWFDLV